MSTLSRGSDSNACISCCYTEDRWFSFLHVDALLCLNNYFCVFCNAVIVLPICQDVEERQGRSGGHQTCQSSGGGEGHVLCKTKSAEGSVCVGCVYRFYNVCLLDRLRAAALVDRGGSLERRG